VALGIRLRALVASGVIPAAVGARSVAEKLGIHSVQASCCPAVAGLIRTDGAAVAATLLVDTVSRDRPPVSA
jgi:hypothetical protein